MSGRLINIEKRACGDNLVSVPGYLMANGAFVFSYGGDWRILTHQHLGGFRGTAGDPHIVSVGKPRVRMNYFKDANNLVYQGDLKRKLGKTTDVRVIGGHPVPPPAVKILEHFSDNLAATASLSSGYVNGSVSDGWTIDIPLGGTTSLTPKFTWSAVNPGSGIDGQPVNALDTYFGGAIGLGTCILIGAPTTAQGSAIVANLWNGTNLVPVGQPSTAFFDQAFSNIGEVFKSTSYHLHRAFPLCRVPDSDAAVCYGEATVNNRVWLNLPDHDGFPWWAHYLEGEYGTSGGATNTWPILDNGVPPFASGSQGAITPSVRSVGLVSRLPGNVRLDITLTGSANILFQVGSGGFGSPYVTGWSANPSIEGIRVNGVMRARSVGVYPGSGYPFVLARRAGGQYEVWLKNDPATPDFFGNPAYQQFSVRTKNYGPNNFWVHNLNYHPRPATDSPYPTQGKPYNDRLSVAAAVAHAGSYFILGSLPDATPVMGMLGSMHASPFTLDVSTPRSAGPYLFMDGWISADNGITWSNHSTAFDFGELTYDAGATTIQWEFGLNKKMLDESSPI